MNATRTAERSANRERADAAPPAGYDLLLAPRRVLRVLLPIIGVLVALSVLGRLAMHFLPEFPGRDFLAYAVYLDNEQNIPTAASFLLLLACAALLWLIAVRVRAQARPYRRHWQALSILFVVLAIDEYMAIHERAIDPLREQLGTGGLLNFAWVIPGMAFVAVLALVFGRFVLSLPPGVRMWSIIAAVLFLSGALAFEMVGGAFADRYGNEGLGYSMISNFEETLELLGLAAFLYALTRYLRDHLDPFEIRIRSGRPAAERATLR